MRKVLFIVTALVLTFAGVGFRSHAENISLKGDYVEVRTASVFAGACHFNGEVTTTGREALMAWRITSGKYQGVDLTGVRVVAVVSSNSNLAEADATRQSEIVIDSPSDVQSKAMMEALKSKYSSSLGNVAKVTYAPVEFARRGATFSVTADNLTMNVEAMPNDLCCKMPNLVWYTPLVGLDNRKVGHTTHANYSGSTIGQTWSRSVETSAFFGTYSL